MIDMVIPTIKTYDRFPTSLIKICAEVEMVIPTVNTSDLPFDAIILCN